MTLWLIVAIITLAFLGESMFGFGGGLVAVPLVSLFIGIREAVTLVLVFQVLMGCLLLCVHRNVAWKAAKLVGIGLLLGVVLGSFSLASLDESVLHFALAAFIGMYLAKVLFFDSYSLVRGEGYVAGTLMGALGGWLHGLIGTGGPPFVMVLGEVGIDKVAFRATLIFLLFVCNLVRVVVSGTMGLFTESLLTMSLPALPFFALALLAGQRFHVRISEKVYRYCIYVVLFIAAVSLTVKGLAP